MNRLKELLRLRKRSDKVKAALLLFLLGTLLGADVVSGTADFFIETSKPVEYVLTSGAGGAVLEGRLQSLRQREGVICASRQREYVLTCGGRSLDVIEISPEYISTCFGLTSSGSGREFFLGREAFISFCGAGTASPARLTCLDGEESVGGAFSMCVELPGAAAITKGTSMTLGDSQTLRVMMDGSDVSGLDETWLGELGFSIENREVLTEAAHRLELLLARLRYGGPACLLALALGVQLFAAGRREAG